MEGEVYPTTRARLRLRTSALRTGHNQADDAANDVLHGLRLRASRPAAPHSTKEGQVRWNEDSGVTFVTLKQRVFRLGSRRKHVA